jgi:hypothetical protein
VAAQHQLGQPARLALAGRLDADLGGLRSPAKVRGEVLVVGPVLEARLGLVDTRDEYVCASRSATSRLAGSFHRQPPVSPTMSTLTHLFGWGNHVDPAGVVLDPPKLRRR